MSTADGTPRHTTASAKPAPASIWGIWADVAEHVGQVADLHGAPEGSGPLEAELEVADDRLARDEELVHEDVPGAERDPSGSRQLAEPTLVLRPNLEVVVDRSHLAVDQEAGIGGVRLHQLEQVVHEVDEAQLEGPEGRSTTPGPSACAGRRRPFAGVP